MSRLFIRIPKYLLGFTLSALNLICVIGLNVCAYSVWLRPDVHPNASYLGLLFPGFLVACLVFVCVWFILGLTGLSFDNGRRKKRRAYWGMLYSVVGIACCAASVRTYWPLNWPEEAPEGALKVMSYNIYGMANPDKLEWEQHPTLQYLRECKADIVCVQEAGSLQMEHVWTLLSDVYPYHQFDKLQGTSLACLSRYPIVGAVQVEYESMGNGTMSYDIVVDGDTLLVVNNHMESYKLVDADREEYKNLIQNNDTAFARETINQLRHKLMDANAIRCRQADAVAEFIEQSGRKYVICCGDFNDASLSYTHNRLTRQLDDAYTRSGNGPGLSYNRSGMYFRIDNILCSPAFRAYGARVDNSIKTSDHYPVSCRLAKE